MFKNRHERKIGIKYTKNAAEKKENMQQRQKKPITVTKTNVMSSSKLPE